MKNRFQFWILFGIILFSKTILAQQYFFTNYTTENGLSNSIISCIAKDKDGFLWIGTEAGLNRFNGYDFTVYKSLASDTTTLPSNVIRHLLVSRSGEIWIATSSGVCAFEKNKNTFRRIASVTLDGRKIFEVEYSYFYQDSKNNIWATTIGLGLMKYDAEGDFFQQIFLSNSPKLLTSITEDDDGIIWATGYTHIYSYNPANNSANEFTNQLHLENNITFQAMGISPDASNKNFLWIGTWGDGLVHFNKQSGKSVSYKFKPGGSRNVDNIIFDLLQHRKNKLWLASNRGTIEFDEIQKKFLNFIGDSLNEKPVANTEVQCLYRDNENIIWIGTVFGLANIHPAKQYFILEPLWVNSPAPEYYYDEQTDKIYGIRFYDKRSLFIYDRKLNKHTTYSIPDADKLRAEPFCVIKDNNDLIWIGTTKGIYNFNEQKKSFSLLKVEKDLQISDRSLYGRNVYKDSNGNLWFACYSKGLLMIDVKNQIYKKYFFDEENKNSFPLVAINSIVEDKSNNIYACDDFLGIVKLNVKKETWEYYNSDNTKYNVLKGASDMTVNSENRIWVTTRNNGLICIDKNDEVTTYIKDEFGQLVDEQKSIALDNSEKIWIPANTGMFRFDPGSKTFTKFTKEDGFPVRTLESSLQKLTSGKIAYHFNNRIFAFDPLKVSKSDNPLKVHLTSFSLNGKISPLSNSIDLLDTLILKHNENNLTFEFAATDFTHAVSTVYRYMLEGNDKLWSSPTQTRNINFSQISPGNYTLRLMAGENSPEKKLFIQIIPAWWQTQWFKWLAAIFLIAILFYVIRFYLSIRYRQKIVQLERQREIEGIRMRISRDIHDEIGSGLAKIKLLSRHLSRISTEKDSMLKTSMKISNASDELIQNLGEIVWTVNPENDSLENLFAFTRNYLLKLFEENSDINLILDFTDHVKIPQNILLNPEVKRNLLLILKESITNVFKHSNATKVFVSLHADKSKIEMSVSDNGKGISNENKNGFGNGLMNMRKRAESIKAQFHIETTSGNGTIISITIPLDNLQIPT